VRGTFAQIAPVAPQAAATFYARLFTLEPPLRRMFRGNLAELGGKLMQMLGAAVAGLHGIEQLAPALHELGRRHLARGVVDAHDDIVGEAFLWTLEQSLGAAFTDEVSDAWASACGLLAGTMKAGASLQAAA